MRSVGRWALAGVLSVACAVPAARANSSAAAISVVHRCTDAALRSAVAATGNVRYGVDCPSVLLNSAFVVGTGVTVSIDANGHAVSLDARQLGRHFEVDGGTLTLIGVELRNGLVVGAAGRPGRRDGYPIISGS